MELFLGAVVAVTLIEITVFVILVMGFRTKLKQKLKKNFNLYDESEIDNAVIYATGERKYYKDENGEVNTIHHPEFNRRVIYFLKYFRNV